MLFRSESKRINALGNERSTRATETHMYLRAFKLIAEAAWKEVDFSIFTHMETFMGRIPTGLAAGALSLAYADALEEAWGKLQAAGDTMRQAPSDAPMILEVQGFEE